jgi:hypothetical protein
VSGRVASWARIRSTILLVVFLVLVMVVLTGATGNGLGQQELWITLVVLVVGLVIIWRPRKSAS